LGAKGWSNPALLFVRHDRRLAARREDLFSGRNESEVRSPETPLTAHPLLSKKKVTSRGGLRIGAKLKPPPRAGK